MKYLLLCSLYLVAATSWSQEQSRRELVQMALQRLSPDVKKTELSPQFEILRGWNNLFDQQNLEADYDKHRIPWRELFPIIEDKVHHIKGSRLYYGLFKKDYRYDIYQNARSNSLVVNLKLHFEPSKTYLKKIDGQAFPEVDELMRQVRSNVADAETLWSLQAPDGVDFKFEVVTDKRESHYSLKLVTKRAGLYDSFIMAPADLDMLVHEIGHMLGLDDEYKIVTSNLLPVNTIVKDMKFKHRHPESAALQDYRCNLESIMCHRQTVYPYHIDHILGRIKLK